jgi:hypothetical protein
MLLAHPPPMMNKSGRRGLLTFQDNG